MFLLCHLLLVRWPASSSNGPVLSLILLLLLTYLKNPFLWPLWCWPTWTLIKLWPQEFSPYSGEQHFCNPAMLSVIGSKYCVLPEEDAFSTSSARLNFCLTCLTSYTLQLPAPVLWEMVPKKGPAFIDGSTFNSRFPEHPKSYSTQSLLCPISRAKVVHEAKGSWSRRIL